MHLPVTLGEKLRELRLADPYMKLRECAKLLKVDFVTWSGIENDRVKPSGEFVIRAARALGGNAGELLALLDEWQEAPPLDLSDPNTIICHRNA